MKGARIRYQQTGEFHFLTFSCFHRRPYLSAGAAMVLFEDALERVRRRYLFVVGGYVVMAGGPCLVRRFIKLRVPPVPRTRGPGRRVWRVALVP